MLSELKEQLQVIDAELEKENTAVMSRLIESIIQLEKGEKEKVDIRKQTEQEKTADLTLRAMRIHVLLKMIQCGDRSQMKAFREDFEKIVEDVKVLEYGWKTNGPLLSDTVDLILLMEPENRNLLMGQLDIRTRLKIRKQVPLKPEVFFAAKNMAIYCLEHEFVPQGCTLMENLIALSEERNRSKPDNHREIIRRALWYLVDVDPPRALKICDVQKQYYRGSTDSNGAWFNWFYGHVLSRGGRLEEAKVCFRTSYELFGKLAGPDDWMTLRSGQAYYLGRFDDGAWTEAETYLWDFVEKAESETYREHPLWDPEIGALTRYVILGERMEQQCMADYLPQIEQNYRYCVSHTDQVRNPRLTIRSAENLYAGYYLERDDLLQSAHHAVLALTAPHPEGIEKMPSDDVMYSNLLHIYGRLNDGERMYELLNMLAERMEQDELPDWLVYRLLGLMQTAERKMGYPIEEQAEAYREDLRDTYEAVRCGKTEELDAHGESVAWWILTMIETVGDADIADETELRSYCEIIRYFQKNEGLYLFNSVQKMMIQFLFARLSWMLGDKQNTMRYLRECMDMLERTPVTSEIQIEMPRVAAVIYYGFGERKLAKQSIEKMLMYLTQAWQKTTSYLNDHKICQVLGSVQEGIIFGYSVLRQLVPDDELYDSLMRVKNLPSLVGRERNRLMKLAPVDERLKEHIFRVQNQLAEAQLKDSQMGTDDARDISLELQKLEAEFAEKFPNNLEFTHISYEKLTRKLQEGEAIIEHFFAAGEGSFRGETESEDALEMDIFVIKKVGGKASLHRLVVPGANQILDQALDYVDILENPKKNARRGKDKIILRAELYRKLLAPVMPYLEGVQKLYIAPDVELSNVPFEILHADGSGVLQEQFEVCRLTCGRDLLFDDGGDVLNPGRFILGDPDYEAEKGEISNAYQRGVELSLAPVKPLPFSGLEARRISRRFRMDACTGKAATKYALEQSLPRGIIHLATHGAFDTEMETDALYSSYLVFAGYNKWVTKKTESTHCGNGVLTADEISRMDLRGTELVVLSACQSGMGDASYGTVQGLISAFSAAGVRWVVSHLWNADDLATAILMEAFYDGYLNRKLSVPEALYQAKEYLRTVTVGELRQKGWFDGDGLSEQSRTVLKEYSSNMDRRALFADEVFWGGFVAHRCK